MPSTLEIDNLTPAQRPGGAWVAGLIQALARDEAAGRRPQRLTEPRFATWTRFRGRLTATDVVALLFESSGSPSARPRHRAFGTQSTRRQRTTGR